MRSLVALGRTAGAAVFAFVVFAVVATAFAPAANAATNAVWGQGTSAPLPVGARGGSLNAVSCAAPGGCTAVGTFTDGSGDQQALLLSESGGSLQAQGATLPADAGANPRATLDAVSCASVGDCTAVGNYTDAAGDTQGLIVSESAGSWSPAVAAAPPSGPSPEFGTLASVSCPTATTCVAVGSYHNAAGNQVGWFETEGAGGFTGQDVVLLPAITGSTGSALTSVSCIASEDCVAVGSSEGPGVDQAIVVNLRSGGWQPAVPAPLPAGAVPTTTGSALASVTCLSSGSCTAVGAYGSYAQVGSDQPLVVVEAADGSLQATAVALGSAATTNGAAESVSCPAVGECAAVGTAGQSRFSLCCETVGTALLLGESNGSWSQTAAMMPSDAASPTETNLSPGPRLVLSSVSCAPAGGCSGGGTYEPAGEIEGFSYANAPLLVNRSGTAWGSGFAPALPADAGSAPVQTHAGPSGPTDVVDAVSCASAGTCTAVGSYTDASDVAQPLVLTSTPGSAPSSLALQVPPAASAGSAIAGSSVSATLSSQAGPTGTVSFSAFGPSATPPTNCSSGGSPVGTASVSGVGSYNPSSGFTPPVAGDYWWYAAYSGDDNAQPSASVCGAGMPETVAAVRSVPPPVVKPTKRPLCSKPTGRLTATAVGPIALGITRRTANRRLTHHTGTTSTERFCLVGGGATHVLYASRHLLAKLPAKTRRHLVGHVVLILTTSPHYRTGGVKIGTTQKKAARALRLGRGHRVGKTTWYLSRIRGGERVIKVRRAEVTEIGVVNPRVLARAGWRAVLRGA